MVSFPSCNKAFGDSDGYLPFQLEINNNLRNSSLICGTHVVSKSAVLLIIDIGVPTYAGQPFSQ